MSVTHPVDRDAVDVQINAAIAAREPYASEICVIHADGSVRWVLERGVKAIDRDGEERLGTVSGKLELVSPPGGGTLLRARVPLGTNLRSTPS